MGFCFFRLVVTFGLPHRNRASYGVTTKLQSDDNSGLFSRAAKKSSRAAIISSRAAIFFSRAAKFSSHAYIFSVAPAGCEQNILRVDTPAFTITPQVAEYKVVITIVTIKRQIFAREAEYKRWFYIFFSYFCNQIGGLLRICQGSSRISPST